jgi:hypothetical protein
MNETFNPPYTFTRKKGATKSPLNNLTIYFI